MKTYKATLTDFGTGYFNPEVMDLINVDDATDKIMAAPDEFTEGEIVTEEQIRIEYCAMVDDQCYGGGDFAFKIS